LIGNDKKSNLAHGNFYLYYLYDNPQLPFEEFGKGLNQQFEGLMIQFKENSARVASKQKQGKPDRMHEVSALVLD